MRAGADTLTRCAPARIHAASRAGIEFTAHAHLTARAPSLASPSNSRSASLASMTCDCGRPSTEGLPCSHLLARASAAHLGIADCMHPFQATVGWKQQHPEEALFHAPSTEMMRQSQLVGANLMPPLRIKKRKGRPRDRRRRGALERQGSSSNRRRIACSRCYREGHNARARESMPRRR